MEATHFLKVQKNEIGPLTTQELQQLIRAKKIKPDDLIWDDQEELWIPLVESEITRELLLPAADYRKQMFALASGKGGVGKSAVTVSLGIALAGLGHRVVLVDADLGGPNLHHHLGVQNPKYTFFDFYTLNVSSLSDIVLPTSVENLFFISGACGTLGLANPKYSQKLRFIRQLNKIEADFILLDLGAGSSYNVIDFFLAAGDGIIVTSPEPAAIQEAFYFTKMALLRKLSRTFAKNEKLAPMFDHDESIWNQPDGFSIRNLYKEVERVDKDAADIFRGILQRFQPKLILNMVMTSSEAREGIALKTAVGEILAVEMDFWGVIPLDEKVREAAMLQKPFMLHKPNGKASKQLMKIATEKIQKYSRVKSYLDRKKLQRLLHRLDVSDEREIQEPVICSVKCSYWDDCEYQNGGYPCSIRSLEIGL